MEWKSGTWSQECRLKYRGKDAREAAKSKRSVTEPRKGSC